MDRLRHQKLARRARRQDASGRGGGGCSARDFQKATSMHGELSIQLFTPLRNQRSIHDTVTYMSTASVDSTRTATQTRAMS